MAEPMKRLLLVAYHFPPNPAVGSRRPGFLARFLPEFGWDVTVLTRAPALPTDIDCAIVAAPVLGASFENKIRDTLNADPRDAVRRTDGKLRGLLQRGREALMFPDNTAPWIPGAIARGFDASRKQRFDAVLSTAMPPAAHVVGAAVAGFRGLPWLADYRDPWSGNAYVRRSPLRASLELTLERRLIRRARGIITVNEPIADQLSALHRKRTVVIPNAFDRDEWERGQDGPPEAFAFCYTGSMYDGKRTPELLFSAIARLREQGHPAARVRLLFYGPNSGIVETMARRFGLMDLVEFRGTVGRAEANAAQRAASGLLMFLSSEPATTGELGSKILEYCGARRPILAFGLRESVVKPFLAEHDLGWFASDVDEATAAIVDAHARYQAGRWNVVPPQGTFFDGRALAKAFADELNAVA
jgi:hypothetical protein